MPPPLMARLLALVLPRADRSPVLAELAELFVLRVANTGEGEARRWYTRQVLIFAWRILRDGRGNGTVGSCTVAPPEGAALGVYGVVSNTVTRRTHEIGIRMALGATRHEVVRQVLGQGLRLAFVGLVIGLMGVVAVSSLLESVMFGVEPFDPVVYGLGAVGLFCVVALAPWFPAHRATRIDPATALTAE